MLFHQCGKQLVVIESLGVVEVDSHFLAERLVPVGDDIEQVANGHDVADLERLPLIDQELHHDLQGCSLSLEHAGNRNQGLDTRTG